MIEADRTQLEGEVRSVVRELNGKGFRPRSAYEAVVREHHSGPAIDIKKAGEPPQKVLAQFSWAAMRAGYVHTGTLYGTKEGYTRLFLQEASEHFDIERERAEGFLAGMLFASMLENAAQEPMEKKEALEYLKENNNFYGGAVIDSEDNDDTVGDLYTIDSRYKHPCDIDTPSGWFAIRDLDGWAFLPEK